MVDLSDHLRELERNPSPDLWSEIEARAQHAPIALPEPSLRRRWIVGLAAAAIGVAAVWLIVFAFRPAPREVQPTPGTDPASPTGLLMPNLVGLQISDAIMIVEARGFVVETIQILDDSQLGEPGADNVVAQDPVAGVSLEPGAGVSLTVTAIAHPQPSPPTAVEGFPTMCDGHPVTIFAIEPGKTYVGTEGDDFVVLVEGAEFQHVGGVDVICDEDGVPEATLRDSNGLWPEAACVDFAMTRVPPCRTPVD